MEINHVDTIMERFPNDELMAPTASVAWAISGEDLWGMEFSAPQWLIESIWPDQSCGFISGP